MLRIIALAATLLCATIGGKAATISGLVSLAGAADEPVTPVQGASVLAYKVVPNHGGYDSLVKPALDSVVTDAEGAYNIAHLDTGRVYLEAGMPGYTFANPYAYANLRSDSGHYIENFRFRDTAQGQVKIKVVRDSAQGRGLAGITIILNGSEFSDTGKTDSDGNCAFARVIPGGYRLTVDSKGFLESFAHPGDIPGFGVTRLQTTSLLVILWPADAKGAIAGKVTKASDGSAVSLAKVVLSRDLPSDTSGYVAVDSTTTGSDGTYKFNNVAVHRDYRLTVKSGGFQTAMAQFDVAFNETFQAPMPLVSANAPGDSGGTVEGLVTDSAGNGLAGAILALVPGGNRKWDSVATDPLGRFIFPKVRMGTYLITASRSGYAAGLTGDFDVADGQTRVIFLDIEKLSSSVVIAEAKRETMHWHAGPTGGIILEAPAMPLAGRVRVYDIRGVISFSGTFMSGASRMEIPWTRGRPGYVVLERGRDFHRLAIPGMP